jgi:serine/threonine protein kinase/tetratricopeptide (TPR) repeat protein
LTKRRQTLELSVGDVLEGKYEIERLLGVGGMGAVYLARRIALGDRVAIKSILATHNTETNRARFLREARAAAAIRHPNVVQVFDFGQPPDHAPYMVMEYLEGPTLAAVLAEGPLSLARALPMFAGVCSAVEAGHRRGVIHRDLKPGNVILARTDDGRETVKVLDFGLARLTGDDGSRLTNPGSMIGTCSYLAPELIDTGHATAASDIWALGVLLYEMVTGRSPFKGPTNAATIMKIAAGDYDPPSAAVPDLPPPVVAGIAAALTHDPSERPGSPEALAGLVGAPLRESASAESRVAFDRLVEMSAVGRPAELEPSMIGGLARSSLSELTISDTGENVDGGEKTIAPSETEQPQPHAATVVGRDHELESLRREYRAVLEGRGRVLVIVGDAGVGKTTVLEEFCKWAAEQGAYISRGRFFGYEGDRPPPYEVFLWMQSSSSSSSSSPHQNRPRRPSSSGGSPASEQDAHDKWQVFSTMAAQFVSRAQGRPLVIALDDLQWATALDLEFLGYLPRAAEPHPVVVVGTARANSGEPQPSELEHWLSQLGAQRSLRTIEVERFSLEEVRAWFKAVFPGIRIRSPDLRRLHHATSGNPFYLAEVVHRLVDDGQIVREAGGWACAPLDAVVLPETVNAVVRSKLEGLSEPVRVVLETACVIGEEFRFETLQRALKADEDELETLLDDAVRRRLLTEDGLTPGSDYRFESATLRGVLYDSLSKRRRIRLHRSVVEAMGELYGHDGDRIAKVLCYHYHAIGEPESTLSWGLRAAAECLRRNDVDSADLALKRAREAVASAAKDSATEDDARTRLDWLTGVLYNRIGRLEEAQALLAGALEHLDAGGDESLRLDVLLELGECHLGRGDFDAGRDVGLQAVEAARSLGDVGRELAAAVTAARCTAPRGDLAAAQALLEPVVDTDANDEQAPIVALALAELGWVHAKRGHFDDAEAVAARGRALARRVGDLHSEYRAVSVLGLNFLEAGDQASAIRYLQEALELARQLSLRRREGVELHNLGEAHYLLGRHDEALGFAFSALGIFTEVRDRATEGDCRVNIGRMLMAKGETEEARVMLEHGLSLASQSGRSEYEGLALVELADLDVRGGEYEQAGARLGRARERLSAIDSIYLWRVELGLGRLDAATGNGGDGLAHARIAAQLLEAQRARLPEGTDRSGIEQALQQVRHLQERLSDDS